MLPLKYSSEFTNQDKIIEEYKSYLNRNLDDCAFNIRLNDSILYKPYMDKHILESGIHFVNIQFPRESQTKPPEKIGILWFTFDRKVSVQGKQEPNGIYVRSKNMLVGGPLSLADAVRNSPEYVSTYREITQSLLGIYGEMLLYTNKLSDNARRDWFRIDRNSIKLRRIIADFLRRLIDYRNAASKAFHNKENEKMKENLVKTYKELTQKVIQEQYVNEFYDKALDKEKKIFKYADEDIPHLAVSYKRFYEKIIIYIRKYCIESLSLDQFIKLRTYIKKNLNEDNKK